MKPLFDFYFITGGKLSKKPAIDVVGEAIEAGVKLVQYREKDASTSEMIREAREIKKLCEKNNVLFVVNDRVDVALAVDADGVHLGQDDMPLATARKILGGEKIIGVTVHDMKEALEAEKNGADYLGLSPIYSTSTKEDAGPAAGLQFIKKVKEEIDLPCVAIGGISLGNLDEVLDAGADGVAAISAVLTKDDVAAEIKKYRKKILEKQKTR